MPRRRRLIPLPLVAATSLTAACGFFIKPPAAVEPAVTGMPVDCTDTYVPPLLDAAAATAIAAYAAWLAYKIDDGCDRGDPDWCDPQAGLAVAFPLAVAVGLAVSAEVGRRKVRRCRSLRASRPVATPAGPADR